MEESWMRMSDQQMNFAAKNAENQEKMVRGSLWMTIGSIASRLLGAIYILPWYAWMGDNAKVANALFNKGYNIYALFLMIATAGIPSAIAKQISYYNSQNEYGVSQRLFKRALALMGILGVVFAGIMFLASPLLAGGDAQLIPVMRALSVAVLVFPCISVIRGFFQGNHDMMPSAMSQIIEQIVRVFYMLIATFIIMKMGSGQYADAVVQSTFAAFIGLLGSFGLLGWFFYKQSAQMKVRVAQSSNNLSIQPDELLRDIIREALPFIIVDAGITFYKLIDQATFEGMMGWVTHYTPRHLAELFSIFSANPDKLTMITVSLATALAVTSLPLITEAYAMRNYQGLAKMTSDNLQLFFFVMLPATLGTMVLAYPLNTFFYGPDKLGAAVLVEAALLALALGLYLLVTMTLQGLYENGAAMKYLAIGLLIKVVIQFPMIALFEVYGPLLATGIGIGVTCWLSLRKIHQLTHFNRSLVARRVLLIFIFSLGMMAVAGIVRLLLGLFLNTDSKLQAFCLILVVAAAGGAAYVYLCLKVKLADIILGSKAQRLRHLLKIK